MNKQAYLAGFSDMCVKNGINPDLMLKQAEGTVYETFLSSNPAVTGGRKAGPYLSASGHAANTAQEEMVKAVQKGKFLKSLLKNKYVLGTLGTLGLAGGGAGLYSMLGGEEPVVPAAPQGMGYGLPGAGAGLGLGALAGYGLGGDATSALLGGLGGGALGYGLGNML